MHTWLLSDETDEMNVHMEIYIVPARQESEMKTRAENEKRRKKIMHFWLWRSLHSFQPIEHTLFLFLWLCVALLLRQKQKTKKKCTKICSIEQCEYATRARTTTEWLPTEQKQMQAKKTHVKQETNYIVSN